MNREPKDSPSGGEFARTARSESATALPARPADEPENALPWGPPEIQDWTFGFRHGHTETRVADLDGELLERAQRLMNTADPVRAWEVTETSTLTSLEPPLVQTWHRLSLRCPGSAPVTFENEAQALERLAAVDLSTPWRPPISHADRQAIRDVPWRTIREEDYEPGVAPHVKTEVADTSDVFERRVRALLGVTDGPVTAERTIAEFNPYGGETWETDEEITVSAGGRSRTFSSMAKLFAVLEALEL